MQHVFQTFVSAGQCAGTNHQTDQQHEQQRHQNLRHFFNTSSTMADDESCQEQEDQREDNSTLQREAISTQHAKEVSHRVSIYSLCFHNVSIDVLHRPTANLAIVAQDDKTGQNAQTACKGPLFIDLAESTDGVFVCFTTNCEFSQHNSCTDQSNHQDVNDQESTAAAVVSFAGEFPDVAQTNCRTGSGQDET